MIVETLSVATLRDQLALLDGTLPVFIRTADGFLVPATVAVRGSGVVEMIPAPMTHRALRAVAPRA